MKCPRCNHRIRGATWYCPNCGSPVESLNVADLLAPRRRWGPFLLAVTALFAVVALGLVLANRAGFIGGPDAVVTLGGSNDIAEPGSLEDSQRGTSSNEDESDEGEADLSSGNDDDSGGAAPDNTPAADQDPRGAEFPPASAPSPVPTAGGGERSGDGETGDTKPSPEPTPQVRPGNPAWLATYMPRSPEIDGALDDWRSEPIEFASVVFGPEHWDGGADLSARMLLGWNSRALFVSARVFDDVFSQPSTGDRLHLGDSLELQLDTDLLGDWDRGVYDVDDWQIGLSPGDFQERPPEWWVWRPALGALSQEASIEIAAERHEDGYSLEAAIPWVLLETRPAGGKALGLSLNISDNDGPEPAQLTMIASSPSRSWSDPRSFGTVVLDGGPPR